jgi:hypothetical protein
MAMTKRATKHRKRRQRAKKVAVMSAATISATALTVGMAPPPPDNDKFVQMPVALTAGPNYTQIIENSSDTLNNLLYAQANFTNAFGSFLNPLAALSGGLLPTVGADVEQNDLTSLTGILGLITGTLNDLTNPPDVAGIPGLPSSVPLPGGVNIPLNDLLQTGLLAGLGGTLSGLGPVIDLLDGVGGQLAVVEGVLDQLTALDNALTGLGLIEGLNIPSLDELIELIGLEATETNYTSTFSWPILGLGGTTNVSNIFAQLPGLGLGSLTASLIEALGVPDIEVPILNGLPVLGGVLTPLPDVVAGLLTPLDDLVSTPSVTAWIPTANGAYTLPFGGSAGFLATMPTVAIGPINVVGIPVSTTDTVLAVPVFAGGVDLPFGLASFGTVATPGIVFPTATGVSTLGGTNLQSFAIPLLGVSYTSVNLLNSTYVGTNGVNYNSGQTVGVLVTPFGPLPIVYSMGKVNFGTTGFGFTGPSLFGVGLIPPIQVGTAPTQQSPDGLIPASLLNLGLALPTQATSVTELLGLPDPQDALDAFVNPAFNATFAPLGALITAYLNDNIGTWANGSSDLALQLTTFLRQLSEQLPGAQHLPAENATLLAASKATEPPATPVETPAQTGETTKKVTVQEEQSPPPAADEEKVVVVTEETDDTDLDTAETKAHTTVKNNYAEARDRLNRIATDGQKRINDTVSGVQKGLNDAAKQIGDGVKKALGGGKTTTANTNDDKQDNTSDSEN